MLGHYPSGGPRNLGVGFGSQGSQEKSAIMLSRRRCCRQRQPAILAVLRILQESKNGRAGFLGCRHFAQRQQSSLSDQRLRVGQEIPFDNGLDRGSSSWQNSKSGPANASRRMLQAVLG